MQQTPSRRRQRDLIRQLEHLAGGRVTLQPAAEQRLWATH
jgi:hypothetical protein